MVCQHYLVLWEVKVTQQKIQAVPVALIGLLGTILTVCSGLTGAGVSACVAIRQVKAGMQQVELTAPNSDQALTVDTRQIVVSYEEATGLDPSAHYVAPELGFVLAQPREGWSGVEEMTYRDLFVERGSHTGSMWDEQPVRRIRYREPVQVQYREGSGVNGFPVDAEMLRLTYGTDAFQFSNEITVLALDKEVTAGYTLAGVALDWGSVYRSGANRIVANEGSDYILMQTSWRVRGVQVDGRDSDLSVERWALFAEGPQNYYVVEVVYLLQAGQPVQVWEDLQAYINSFRVIR